MTSLLDRSLDDIARNEGDTSSGGRGRGRGRGGRGRVSSGSGRASPYSKPPARVDPDGAWQHDLFGSNKLDYGGDGEGNDRSRRSEGARSTRLKITNLQYEVSERELETLFAQIGPLSPGTDRESNPAIKTSEQYSGRPLIFPDLALSLGINLAALAYVCYASRPLVKFDASGRSMGEATVTYESEADAARAKEAFDNALAKGERMKIEYDFSRPRRAPRQQDGLTWKSIPAGGLPTAKGGMPSNSLLARMDSARDLPKQSEYASSIGRSAGPRSIRDGAPTRGAESSSRGRGAGRGGGRGRAGDRPQREGRQAKTAEDLDKELEEFMSKGTASEGPPAASAGDVEMS